MLTHTPPTAPSAATASEFESENGDFSGSSTPVKDMVSIWGSNCNLQKSACQLQTLPPPSESRAEGEPADADAKCSSVGSASYLELVLQIRGAANAPFQNIWEMKFATGGAASSSLSAAASQQSPAAENRSDLAPGRETYLEAQVLQQPDTSDTEKPSTGTV